MGAFRITGNLLMSFALYWGVVALLYGGTDVAKSSTSTPVASVGYVDTAEHFAGTDLGKV